MQDTKIVQKFTFLLCIAVVVFATAAKAEDYVRPANPTMDYVPQNIGVYDTYYENFKEPDCRVCHGESTAERHHSTAYALSSNCAFCHFGRVFIEPVRNCKICHIDGGRIGDFGFPHHRSDFADSGKCNRCHLYVVETNSVELPSYQPSELTPTPYSCENCHWPSGDAPHTPPSIQDWRSWVGFPVPTTWPSGKENPQPIEANGPVSSGSLNIKFYKPIEGTHHEITGKVYPKCYNCHGSSPDTDPSWDANDPYLIRFCENCHSVGTLHAIQEHVTTNGIYTVGGLVNQSVTANEKCMACHGDALQEPPPLPADVPMIDRLEPNFGPSGIIVNIFPASGTCFNEDPVNGLCSFGLRSGGDRVEMGQKDIQGNWWWVDVLIRLWSEHLIQIKVPDNTFQAGNTRIRIHKEGLGTSTDKVFNLKKLIAINSLNPSVGNWGQAVDISGEGFGVRQETVYQDGYGYSTYVELSKSTIALTTAITYRVTKYSEQEFWDPSMFTVKLKDLLDVNKGSLVIEQDLYEGYWNVKVITDFFKDDGDGKYNYGLAGLDTPTTPQGTGTGDELLYRVLSDSLCFKVTRDVYIDSIQPDPVPYDDVATVHGSNFGSTQGTSLVRIWKNQKTSFIIAQAIFWSTTKIKFKVPKFGTALSTYPKEKFVQVKVLGKPGSNHYLIKIIKPQS